MLLALKKLQLQYGMHLVSESDYCQSCKVLSRGAQKEVGKSYSGKESKPKVESPSTVYEKLESEGNL